jgi:hypothetical protein
VMEKNPHTADAQQLAALIVAKLRAARWHDIGLIPLQKYEYY